MERIHPKLSYAAACAMIAIAISSSGCKSSSSGMAGSPFMSPDRVPPPNTRAILPGQAQPYYQGDPVPPMQSATGPKPTAIAALPAEAETRTPSGRTLSWTQPGAAAPNPASLTPPVAAPVPVAVAPQVPQSQPVVAAEAPVGVPIDGDPLRFPLPVPQPPETAAPIASAPVLPTNLPQSPPVQPTPQVAAAPQPNVQLATYNTPVQFASPTQINLPTINAPQQVASPWRSPQVAQAASAPNYTPQPVPAQQFNAMPGTLVAPQSIPPNTMAATLRAVDSTPQPGDPMPRVRIPGYVASQTSADGFRPRTSMQ